VAQTATNAYTWLQMVHETKTARRLERQFIKWGILKRLNTLSLFMANEATKTATTVRTRLSAEEQRRLKAYADRMGLPGLSTALRSLAFENLTLKEAQQVDEHKRRKAAEEAVRRQLGGS